jgi:hypothetical protein
VSCGGILATTVSPTGIVTEDGLALGELTTTWPTYDPAARLPALTEIETLAEVCPDDSATESQFPPPTVLATAVNGVEATLLKIDKLWGEGVAASSRRYVKFKLEGATVRIAGLAGCVTVPL